MHILLKSVVALGCFTLAGAAAAAAIETRKYPLPEHGTLSLQVPMDWQDSTQAPSNGNPPTITFTPKSGTRFQVLLTPYYPIRKGMEMPKLPEVRASVAAAAQRVKRRAVENAIPIKQFKRGATSGYYFSATDQAPKRAAFKHMTQGMLRVGDLAPTFTILTNERSQAVGDAALAMLASAKHEPAGKQ